ATVHLETHGLAQVTLCNGADCARHLDRGPHEVIDERVDGCDLFAARPDHPGEIQALLEDTFFPDHAADAGHVPRAAIGQGSDVVEGVGQLAVETGEAGGEPYREIAVAKLAQR